MKKTSDSLREDETKNEQWRRSRKKKAKMTSKRKDGEEIKEDRGDGERRKERTLYLGKWSEEGDSEVGPEGGEGHPEFLEDATYPRKCRVSQIPQL